MSHRDIVMRAFDDFFTPEMLKGKRILDVGCRGCALKEKFKERGLYWNGLDKNPVGGVIHGDMCAMPIRDDDVDIVFVCHSLEHVETPISALREFKRVVKPDGYIFIATPSPCFKQIMDGDDDHIMVMHPMQMSKWFEYAGITIERIYLQNKDIKNVHDYNVISIGRKK